MPRCLAHTTIVVPRLYGTRGRERQMFPGGTLCKESMRDFFGRLGVNLSNTVPYGTVQLFEMSNCLTPTGKRQSLANQLGSKVSACSYPRPQWWWRRSSSDDKLSHFGNNQVSYKLSVLFHMLPNQGHWAVHHLPQEGKTTVSEEFSWCQMPFSTHLSHQPALCLHVLANTSSHHSPPCWKMPDFPRCGISLMWFFWKWLVLSPTPPSSFPSQPVSQAKPSGRWRLLNTNLLLHMSWGDASEGWGLSGIVTQYLGVTLQQKGPQEKGNNMYQSLRRWEQQGLKETFGINQDKALHPERGNKHHRCVMNRMSPKQQHPVQESKLVLCMSSWFCCDTTASQASATTVLRKAGKKGMGEGELSKGLWGKKWSGNNNNNESIADPQLCSGPKHHFQQFIINQMLCKHQLNPTGRTALSWS